MKKIEMVEITDEYFGYYEDDIDFDESEFDTENEIEVRIPFEGYLSLKVKVKNPQVAMAEVLKANDNIGILSCVGGRMEIDCLKEDETYAIIDIEQ